MKSEAKRSHRFNNNQKIKKKDSKNKSSASPTLTSSYSQKSLWARSYKNQPAPQQLRRKLWGKRFNFDVDSDCDQQKVLAVMEEQQNQGNQKKRKILPHFKIIQDQGEFISKRSRIKSQFGYRQKQKCKSVQSLKLLPKVVQQKRQQDDLRKLQRSKLSYFKDKNQFNQRKRKSSDSYTEKASKVQSLQADYYPQTNTHLPEEIQENQAEETKSDKLPTQRIITSQIQKLIVDQLDSRKRKQQSKPKEIEQIIEQQKLQQQVDNRKLAKLRQSIQRFQSQNQYLKYHRDEEYVRKSGGQQLQEQINPGQNYVQLNEEQNQQKEQMNERYALIQEECSSSGNQQYQKTAQQQEQIQENGQKIEQEEHDQEENEENQENALVEQTENPIYYKVETVPEE